MKRVLQGITKLEEIDQWSRFVGEVRMMLDGFHPWMSAFLRAISALERPPDRLWVGNTAHEIGVSQEQMWFLFDDVWWILRTRTGGRVHDVVLHVAETHADPSTRA